MVQSSTTKAPALTQFPNEIIENIVHNVNEPSTLAAMMQVSRRMCEIAGPRLYNDMVIRGSTNLRAFTDAPAEVVEDDSNRVVDTGKLHPGLAVFQLTIQILLAT